MTRLPKGFEHFEDEAAARAVKMRNLVVRRPIAELLDALPFETLSATARHRTTLGQLGCRTLGDIRKLPRGGVSRRFDKETAERPGPGLWRSARGPYLDRTA